MQASEPAPGAGASLPPHRTSLPVHRPILPKPLVPNDHDILVIRKRLELLASRKRCRVLGCPIFRCKLRTHQDWRQHPQDQKAAANGAPARYHSNTQTRFMLDNGIVQGGVDGAPRLPELPDGVPQQTILRELFNAFYSYEYDRIVRIVSPPPISASQVRTAHTFKEMNLAAAQSQSMACLHSIATAHFPRTSQRQRADHISTMLQGSMLKSLRKKLDDFEVVDIADVVLVMFTVVNFQIAVGQLDTLALHKNALKHLVSRVGGLHNANQAIPFIIALDRLLSIFTSSAAYFSSPSCKPIRRPAQHPEIYGSSFWSFPCKDTDEVSVKDHCIDNCRAIELLEGEGWDFRPVSILLSQDVRPNIHYLYFLREALSDDFVDLNARWADKHDVFRCMLLATKIVNYIALLDNYNPMIPCYCAETIRRVINRVADAASMWGTDVSIWILFVLSIVRAWNGRCWAIDSLRNLLSVKYADSNWPAAWKTIERKNILSFAWSTTRLDSLWELACDDLVGRLEVVPEHTAQIDQPHTSK